VSQSRQAALLLPARPRKQYRLAILAIVVAALGLALIVTIARNPNMHWGKVAYYFHYPTILRGVIWTITLTFASMALATVVGLVLAMMQIGHSRILAGAARGYIWLFRGVPVLVQLIFWYNLALVFPKIGLGLIVPGAGGFDTNSIVGWFLAALLSFGLMEAAYMAEIIRSGFLAIDRGQYEAADSLGLPHGQALRAILIPQVVRIVIPPGMNQLITTLKSTSLVAFIAGSDLMSSAQFIYSENFAVIPLLITVTAWYLILVAILTIVQGWLEVKFARGYARDRA
jgi:polar amino acid transport system permease protein